MINVVFQGNGICPVCAEDEEVQVPLFGHAEQEIHQACKICWDNTIIQRARLRDGVHCPGCRINVTHINGEPIETYVVSKLQVQRQQAMQ